MITKTLVTVLALIRVILCTSGRALYDLINLFDWRAWPLHGTVPCLRKLFLDHLKRYMARGYIDKQRIVGNRSLPTGLSAKVVFAILRIVVAHKATIFG